MIFAEHWVGVIANTNLKNECSGEHFSLKKTITCCQSGIIINSIHSTILQKLKHFFPCAFPKTQNKCLLCLNLKYIALFCASLSKKFQYIQYFEKTKKKVRLIK